MKTTTKIIETEHGHLEVPSYYEADEITEADIANDPAIRLLNLEEVEKMDGSESGRRNYATVCPDCGELKDDCCTECGCCPDCRGAGCGCYPEMDAAEQEDTNR